MNERFYICTDEICNVITAGVYAPQKCRACGAPVKVFTPWLNMPYEVKKALDAARRHLHNENSKARVVLRGKR